MPTTWPKVRPKLTQEQAAVIDDWYGEFLTDTLPGKFGWIDRFNHTYAARTAVVGGRTLEIGPGTGSHLEFEHLDDQEEYVGVELRDSLSSRLDRARFPNVRIVVGDCQARLDFPDASFDRVLAIHILEHLDNLPAVLGEVRRLLRPDGRFSVVIPCEGGLGYGLGRRVTVQRQFERRYGMPYGWMISYEHVNRAREVLAELRSGFHIEHIKWFPTRIPSVDLNVVVGLTLRPLAEPSLC